MSAVVTRLQDTLRGVGRYLLNFTRIAVSLEEPAAFLQALDASG